MYLGGVVGVAPVRAAPVGVVAPDVATPAHLGAVRPHVHGEREVRPRLGAPDLARPPRDARRQAVDVGSLNNWTHNELKHNDNKIMIQVNDIE